MKITNKGLNTLCIPLLATFILLSGCEEPGSVGNEFVDKSELTFDTLFVNQTSTQNFIGYSGRLSYVTIGNYSDPLFGDLNAVALLKPTSNGDSLSSEYSLQLEVQLDSTYTYGDSLSTASFNIYEITSEWNGTNYKINDALTYDESTVIGSFSVGEEKRFTVDLTNTWRDKFASYVNYSGADEDSLFQYEFKGLAIVPDGSAMKMISPRISQTKFVAIKGGTEPDTSLYSLRDWAYKVERANSAYPADVSPLHSTLESIMFTDLSSLIPAVQGKNLIKAELVLYEAKEILEASVPVNVERPQVSSMSIHLGYETDPAYEFMFGNIELLGSKRATDNSFRFNITNYINSYLYGSEEGSEMYIGIGSTAGLLRSTLIYNEAAAENLRPMIILTFLEDND